MGDYNSNFRGGGRSSGGYRGRNSGGGGFGGRDEGPRMMHKAVCAECGNECQVPFRPSGDRPVYCSNCFEKRSEEGRPQFQERRPNPRQENNGQLMQEIRSLNAKLDRILRVLEPQAPKESKPVEVDMIESIVATPIPKKTKTAKKKPTTLPL